MLYAYSDEKQEVASGGDINIDTNKVLTGVVVTHDNGSAVITLNRSGFYEITAHAVVSTAGTDGVVVMQAYADDEAYPGTVSKVSSADNCDIGNLSTTFLIGFCRCGCHTTKEIKFKNLGVTADYHNFSVTVAKIA